MYGIEKKVEKYTSSISWSKSHRVRQHRSSGRICQHRKLVRNKRIPRDQSINRNSWLNEGLSTVSFKTKGSLCSATVRRRSKQPKNRHDFKLYQPNCNMGRQTQCHLGKMTRKGKTCASTFYWLHLRMRQFLNILTLRMNRFRHNVDILF